MNPSLITTPNPEANAISSRIELLDVISILVVFLGGYAYLQRDWFSRSKPQYDDSGEDNCSDLGGKSITEQMNRSGERCIIFYGSQSGTAETYAKRLANEGRSRYSLEISAADLEDYDFDDLCELPSDTALIFILATYGDGEPTDNAVKFYNFITRASSPFQDGLDNLHYAAFGLGSTTYDYYNAVVRRVSSALDTLGAHKMNTIGEGDSGLETTDEDFLSWKEEMWPALAKHLNIQENCKSYEAAFNIAEEKGLTPESRGVFTGEFTSEYFSAIPKQGIFTSKRPYIAQVMSSRELYNSPDRNCLHMELDLGDSQLSYQAGDHVAIHPMNSNVEVQKILRILGLSEKRETVISISGRVKNAPIPIPTPTTYEAIFRYYLDIGGPVSWQTVAIFTGYAPDEATKARMGKLSADMEAFVKRVTARRSGRLVSSLQGSIKPVPTAFGSGSQKRPPSLLGHDNQQEDSYSWGSGH